MQTIYTIWEVLHLIKKCAYCGQEFETKNPQKIYCNRPHYTPCPVCGKPVLKKDNDFSRPNACCSNECRHELRKRNMKPKKCIFCGEIFYPRSGVALVCDKPHFQPCEICGKLIPRTIKDTKTTCSEECLREKLRRQSQEKYGTDFPMQNPEVKKHFKESMKKKYGVEHALQKKEFSDKQKISAYKTNMEHNGVPYACLLPQCINAQGHIVSSYNRKMYEKLVSLGIECTLEKRIENHSYDICIESAKTLIEIDPTYTHNIIGNHWNSNGIDPNYHLEKTMIAEKNSYRCIHVFDWDDWDKIIDLVAPKKRIYARNCEVFFLNRDFGRQFLIDNHLQGSCRGQQLMLGLIHDGELYQVMTFGRSRYDKKHDLELLRLCTKRGFSVVGGASKLMKEAVTRFEVDNVISYCDRSKFNGVVYEKMGMKKIRETAPQEIWSNGQDKITANLLRQRGFDQLFGTNYGKGTSNEQLMMEHGWLPIFDCGQAVYEMKN